MSGNREKPHVKVLPEDDANSQLATGFVLHDPVALRAIQVLPPAGGRRRVRDLFQKVHVAAMGSYPGRHMVLLVDFDGHSDRLEEMKKAIPGNLTDRVFVIGVWSEPEKLKKEVGKGLEAIGDDLANDCRNNTRGTWNHGLLRHNAKELDRMTLALRPILFPLV